MNDWKDWPWTKNPHTGRAHPLDWFMWRVARVFKGRWVRLPFTGKAWRIDDDD